MADRRKALHKLVDRLPDAELPRIQSILEEAVKPEPGRTAVLDRIDEMIEDLTKDVPEEEWAKIPTDLSYNHDHYAYGTPKKKLPKTVLKKK